MSQCNLSNQPLEWKSWNQHMGGVLVSSNFTKCQYLDGIAYGLGFSWQCLDWCLDWCLVKAMVVMQWCCCEEIFVVIL